ncbi:helix-turn-helix transcriptional regulator [Actinoplanes sp. NPDC026619]|uniref:helix-turn-helix domain-containing protein n=1 Tax=Actinoplanes sp. NPDC026619 TaxID=3155798 RepID=UPI0033DBCDF4
MQIELRKSREATRRSQKEVADALAWSPSKLLRIENGAVGITVTDLRALLDHYGVRDRKRVEELTKLAQASRRLNTATYGSSVPQSTIKFWNLRTSAVRVRQFETLLIPGLLQTEEYAREVITAYSTPDLSPEDIDDRVAARMDQKGLLDREERPELYFMIDEAALRRWVGGREVMRNQVEQLKKEAERPGLTIQILPFDLGVHGGIRGPFQILEFAEGTDYVLYLDDASGGIASRDMEAETERYLTLFWDLENIATKQWELNEFLDRVLADLHTKPADENGEPATT